MHVNFFDTNIVLYLLDTSPKAEIAETYLSKGGYISVQVLNESWVNCRKKARMSAEECNEFLESICQLCSVISLTEATHRLARALSERYNFAVYDSLIVASALEAGCTTLFSEDMQNGLCVENSLIIRNPFV